MSKPPSNPYRLRQFMGMKSVHIQCLDNDKVPIKNAYASGFIIQENNHSFLYTCWHVVTGFDMHNIKIGFPSPPIRKYIKITLQEATEVSVGGNQSIIIPLYKPNDLPAWIQNEQDVPHPDLNAINLKVPFWHDAVKILLPENILLSHLQIIKDDEIFNYIPLLGEKIYIVGYPYGYSALGMERPTAIVLTRFIAARKIKERREEILLDGPGAPGMSGGPAFIECDNMLYLFGIYTGLIYPDYNLERNEKTTSLGTCSQLAMWWVCENPEMYKCH